MPRLIIKSKVDTTDLRRQLILNPETNGSATVNGPRRDICSLRSQPRLLCNQTPGQMWQITRQTHHGFNPTTKTRPSLASPAYPPHLQTRAHCQREEWIRSAYQAMPTSTMSYQSTTLMPSSFKQVMPQIQMQCRKYKFIMLNILSAIIKHSQFRKSKLQQPISPKITYSSSHLHHQQPKKE